MKQHTSKFLDLVAESKKNIKEISPTHLKEKLDRKEPLQLIDVREESEWNSSGHIPGAIHLPKGIIERDIEKAISDSATPIVVYCSGGFRCALVADSLQKMGYKEVYSLESGSQGWEKMGYPVLKNK
ncbi:MAG: rhodanese-like domain-containing protein [Legionella sp.]|nr:rhodanese-like domain-containing protein [Legionella sp.]